MTYNESTQIPFMFLKKKDWEYKKETSSSTVLLEAVMVSCAIDAKERQYLAATDIPGAFLHADMNTDIHMLLLEGTIVELIVKLESRLYCK